jgi:RNA polymerase sigma factor (sigma-70 family)
MHHTITIESPTLRSHIIIASVSAVTNKLTRSEVAEIHQTYGHMMLRRCRFITRSAALADDAFQEAFINLIRYGKGFREADKKLRWLYRLCDRACFAQLKKSRREVPIDTADRLSDSRVHTDARLESRNLVLTILAQLDETEQEVAVLAHLDGLSQADIGQTLGYSRQTINKKLQQIQAKVEAWRKQQEDHDG